MKKILSSATCLLLCSVAFGQGVLPQSDWNAVRALSVGSRVRVVSDRKKAICFVEEVTSDHLSCLTGKTSKEGKQEYERSEVKEIKLTHRARSGAMGAGVGFAVGAGAGALIGLSINGADKGSLMHVSSSKASGVGAALGGVGMGLIGGAVGYAKDVFAGPVVYRRAKL